MSLKILLEGFGGFLEKKKKKKKKKKKRGGGEEGLGSTFPSLEVFKGFVSIKYLVLY